MNGGFGGRLAVTFACLLALAGMPNAAAAATATGDGPMEFADGKALAVTPEKLEAGIRVEVLNNRAQDRPLRISVSDLQTAKGKRLSSAEVLRPPRAEQTLPGSGALTIQLASADGTAPTIAAGTYEGFIAVTDTESGTVIRRAISLAVEDPKAKAPPKPAIDKLSVLAKTSLFKDDDRTRLSGDLLPLDTPKGTAPAGLRRPKQPIRGVLGRDGGVAGVIWNGKPGDVVRIPVDSKRLAAVLDVTGVDGVGEYNGKIDLLPDDDKAGVVEVKLTVSDRMRWACLAILLGILLGFFIKRYNNVWRVQSNLRARLVEIVNAFDVERAKFRSAIAGLDGPDRYSISRDFFERAKQADGEIESLEQPWQFWRELDKTAHDAVVAKLGALLEVATSWGLFGAELASLERQHRAAERLYEEDPHGDRASKPKAILHAATLLEGKPIGIEEFVERRAAVRSSSAFLTKWQELWRLLGVELRWRDKLQRLGGISLDEVTQALRAIRDALHESPTADALRETEAQKLLIETRQKLAGLTPDRVRAPAALAAANPGESVVAVEQEADTLAAAVKAIPAEPPAAERDVKERDLETWEKLGQDLRRRRWRADLAFTLLALLIALATGLKELYFDEAFGTKGDYVAAILWGLGIEGALALLTGAIASLGGLPTLQQSITVPQLAPDTTATALK